MTDTFPLNIFSSLFKVKKATGEVNDLTQASHNKEYVIKKINTVKDDLRDFLFTLGCFEGERITVLSVLSENYVIVVKDARYSIDRELAEAIIIES